MAVTAETVSVSVNYKRYEDSENPKFNDTLSFILSTIQKQTLTKVVLNGSESDRVVNFQGITAGQIIILYSADNFSTKANSGVTAINGNLVIICSNTGNTAITLSNPGTSQIQVEVGIFATA